MGQRGYLDKDYKRIDKAKIAEMYREAMPNVSIYKTEESARAITKRMLVASGKSMPQLIEALQQMMYEAGEGTRGGMGRKLPIDENYILSMPDDDLAELIRYANKPQQKVILEDELEGYLADGWRYVSSLNNGSGKCIITKN